MKKSLLSFTVATIIGLGLSGCGGETTGDPVKDAQNAIDKAAKQTQDYIADDSNAFVYDVGYKIDATDITYQIYGNPDSVTPTGKIVFGDNKSVTIFLNNIESFNGNYTIGASNFDGGYSQIIMIKNNGGEELIQLIPLNSHYANKSTILAYNMDGFGFNTEGSEGDQLFKSLDRIDNWGNEDVIDDVAPILFNAI